MEKLAKTIAIAAILQVLTLFPKQSLAVTDSCNAYPDLFYEYQLALIDNETAISYDFTPQVKRYLQIYIDSRKDQVSTMLNLSKFYFPLFEATLKKYNLPIELKYLATIESALDACAISKSNAVGLWQFKINSGQLYGLNVTPFVDERMDPIKSTEAACKYLQSLYKTFNDWHLALTAYNIGPTALQSIIKKNRGETKFWKLYPNLPETAQNYVPAFIAASYIMQNYKSHGIQATNSTIPFSETKTINIDSPVDLKVLANITDIDLEVIKFLNPQFIKLYAPANYSIRVPSGKYNLVTDSIKQICTLTAESNVDSLQVNPQKWIIHTVVSGDSMIKIANLYSCTINDLRLWNPQIDTSLSIGTILKIQVDR